MLFAIFQKRKGAYASSAILVFAALSKDPAGGLPAVNMFEVSNWDLRVGAALFYATA